MTELRYLPHYTVYLTGPLALSSLLISIDYSLTSEIAT